jgi:hypothetical protein
MATVPASYRNEASGSQRKSSKPLICLKFGDVLASPLRGRAWILASLKPKLFCGVALRRCGRPSGIHAARGSGLSRPNAAWPPFSLENRAGRRGLRHNNCQRRHSCERSRATPPHRQNLLDVALRKWTDSPNERLYGYGHGLSSAAGPTPVTRRINCFSAPGFC